MRELFHSNAQQELQEIKALFESSETMDAIAKKLQDTRARRVSWFCCVIRGVGGVKGVYSGFAV